MKIIKRVSGIVIHLSRWQSNQGCDNAALDWVQILHPTYTPRQMISAMIEFILGCGQILPYSNTVLLQC